MKINLKIPDTKTILLEESNLTDEQFEKRNLLNLISSAFFMIAGPLFIYFGFYFITWPYSVKWGSLSIAIGFLLLLFGFSLWNDRQIQTQHRLYRQENREIMTLLQELIETKK